jgi:hypothetical protein
VAEPKRNKVPFDPEPEKPLNFKYSTVMDVAVAAGFLAVTVRKLRNDVALNVGKLSSDGLVAVNLTLVRVAGIVIAADIGYVPASK